MFFQLHDEAAKLLSFQTLGTRMSQLDNIIKRRVKPRPFYFGGNFPFLICWMTMHRRTKYSSQWKQRQEISEQEKCLRTLKEKRKLFLNYLKKWKSGGKWFDHTRTCLGFVFSSAAFWGACTWKRSEPNICLRFPLPTCCIAAICIYQFLFAQLHSFSLESLGHNLHPPFDSVANLLLAA